MRKPRRGGTGSVIGMSETETAAATGPVLRMCGNPDCGGEGACNRVPDRPAFAYKAIRELSIEGDADAWVCATLAERFAEVGTDCDTGVMRFIPDGTEFTVHKGDRGLPEDQRRPGFATYSAIYSGTAPRAEIMAGAPLFDAEKAKARLNLMRRALGNDEFAKTDACWP
jgi:hypothetical protein